MQTDIAKYAMWLFHHSDTPRERLPALYDHLCRKNPVRSASFSFQEFEELFQQWHWQQVSSEGNPQQTGCNHEATDQNGTDPHAAVATSAHSVSHMLAQDAAPISDYHVVTDMLIERLVTSVKQYLDDGWVPLGGICRTSSASSASYWAQAMVKRQVN